METRTYRRLVSFFGILILLATSFGTLSPVTAALANTPDPTSVTIASSLQSELGCSGDWQPNCAATQLTYDTDDDVWQQTFDVPAGSWEYKAALNDSWTENYGLHATPGGDNIPLNLGAPATVKFYYDHKSHWITDNQNSVIVTAAGSFQSELGCPGDWQPDCLRSWLEDPDGDGVYTFVTTALPAGSYEAKATLNESWDVNYGLNGVQNGPNIPFTVPVNNAKVTFTYNSSTHVLSILAGHGHDNNVEWDGLRHDSRDTLYRTPGGAVPAGTPVTIRFRTFHDDVTSVKMRLYDINASAQQILSMHLAATDVSCYQPGFESETCDYWAVTLPNASPDNYWYRFIVTDGTSVAYYADNTAALDGGLGAVSDHVIDNSYALMVYSPSFTTPSWARNAVIYQIFPDRFRNGRASNDPHTGDPRYDEPVIHLPWGTLPEGYCHNYAGATPTSCPWRFGAPSGVDPNSLESPQGRDYMGGDLKGVDQNLDYLKSLGVNTIYFNPIFDSASNHGYDTQDYFKIDPYFGTQKDWQNLVKHANQLGIRIILDGVFNHMSSDSPFFDRYHHFATVGACESNTSQYRSWFTFHDVAQGTGTCVDSHGNPNSATYDGWFGFDSIPVLNKSNPAVEKYFVTGSNSVSKYWLGQGAGGWRLDVMGDSSFPSNYWSDFRSVVKAQSPSNLIIGELWQKDSTLLRFLRGDRADTTMDYRLRDAVVGLLAPQAFDPKGFPDSGQQPLLPSQFAARISSIREDYPDAAFYSLMNLVDSHDTARILWVLTPGANTTADKELNAANVAEGKHRQMLASLIQFTMPGAPTIYYGDEVGVTGNDDPDTRRTYPWADLGGSPDTALLQHYQTLAGMRAANGVFRNGDLRMLLADDAAGVVAYGRKTNSQAGIVAMNISTQAHTIDIPVAGYIPDGVQFSSLYGVGTTGSANVTVASGAMHVSLDPESALILATAPGIDLQGPAAPTGLQTTEGNSQVSLVWNAVGGAASYNLYRSPVSGGGYVKVNANPITGTDFTDTGLRNGQVYFYVITALDASGNESTYSHEASAQPHYSIGWANTQWPPTLTHTLSASTRTDNVYGQIWIDGVTNQPGATPGLIAQLGFGPEGSNPANNPAWSWVLAQFNVDAGNNDEYMASMLPETAGTFDYLYRYSTTGGRDWLYADLDGPVPSGELPSNPGKMTVNPSSDTTPPSTPTDLHMVSASPSNIDLAWTASTDETLLYGYEVLRSDTSGGPYTQIARVTSTNYSDTDVTEGATYYYVVRALDDAFNRSGNSNEVAATAELRTVSVTFNVTVPTSTDGTGRSVYIAGTLSLLDGGLPDWDPGGVVLTRVDSTHWTITLSGREGTDIQYKYTLGDWDHVEKDASCGEINNRMLTLSYGSDGTQIVNDTVPNWRNVPPCGN